MDAARALLAGLQGLAANRPNRRLQPREVEGLAELFGNEADDVPQLVTRLADDGHVKLHYGGQVEIPLPRDHAGAATFHVRGDLYQVTGSPHAAVGKGAKTAHAEGGSALKQDSAGAEALGGSAHASKGVDPEALTSLLATLAAAMTDLRSTAATARLDPKDVEAIDAANVATREVIDEASKPVPDRRTLLERLTGLGEYLTALGGLADAAPKLAPVWDALVRAKDQLTSLFAA